MQEAQEAMKAALNPSQLAQFSIVGRDTEFDEHLGGKIPSSGVVSMKTDANERAAAAQLYKKSDKKNRSNSVKQKQGGFKKRKA